MVHNPVLLQEVLKYLELQKGEFIIDGTVDGGGHMAAILGKIGPEGVFLGIDWNRQVLELAKERIATTSNSQFSIFKPQKNLILEVRNYADLPEILKEKNLPKADGLLLDLGFSSEQLENFGRGFSFRPAAAGEPLIMTYSDDRKPVAQILRELKEAELADIIFQFGGERYSRRIAKAIKEKSKEKPIVTSGELAEIIRSAVPKNYERGRIDPATRTFQALRIYVNDELGNLERALQNLSAVLRGGGRAVVISFHSLEDRLVKNAFRELAKAGRAELLTKKLITASEEEIKTNPRSRSAKLRAIRVVANNTNNVK